MNNNLNNNNNNANKNNINAVNQDSNSVSSNTNAVNQLMVTILPIPGKRSVENLIRNYEASSSLSCQTTPPVTEPLADFALALLLEVASEKSESCRGYKVCLATKKLIHFVDIAEAFSVSLHSAGLSPFITATDCEELFSACFSM